MPLIGGLCVAYPSGVYILDPVFLFIKSVANQVSSTPIYSPVGQPPTARRSTLHHAVKNKRLTVQGPVKKPQMDYMSHRGWGGHN